MDDIVLYFTSTQIHIVVYRYFVYTQMQCIHDKCGVMESDVDKLYPSLLEQRLTLKKIQIMNSMGFAVLPLVVKMDVSGVSLDSGRRFVLLLFTSIMFISVFLNLGVISACFYRRCNSPMLLYIALASIADTSWGISGMSSILNSTIASRQEILFSECLLQLFCIHISNFQQSLTMWLMYVDRHWAIFYPYSYVALIANKGGAFKLAALVWTIGLLLSISFVVVATQLVFCNTTVVIPDFTCSFGAVQKSSCGSNFANVYTVSALYLVLGVTAFTAIYSTYCIIRKCRKSTTEICKTPNSCFHDGPHWSNNTSLFESDNIWFSDSGSSFDITARISKTMYKIQ
uniref:olfactory receptor 13C8-like n=1 Tax=Myxine glutinosa TaxID=7769 RepID=UPI00358FC309